MANRIAVRSAPFVRRAPKRDTAWFQFLGNRNTMTAAGGTIYYSLNAAALALRPFTVVCSRFELFLLSDNAAGAELQAAAFGFAVVSDQAAAIGVTAVPTPVTDMGSDLWLLYKYCLGSGNVAGTLSGQQGFTYSVDSKAMRKVDIGQDLVGVAELDAVGSGLSLTVAGRMLVKLH